MIEIDGSEGEGGGQVVRSSLTLAMITGRSFRINNVRGRRKKPGLKRQHLTAVHAAKEVCSAKCEGDALNSSALEFVPSEMKTGEFNFQIGTAGSATLVAQTLIPALAIADTPTKITVEGGTHNPMAPCFDYLSQVYLPLFERMGPSFQTDFESFGFYPAGGGKFSVTVHPQQDLEGMELFDRGSKCKPEVISIVSDLPKSIGERENKTIMRKMNWDANRFSVVEVEKPKGPGNAILVFLKSSNVTELFTAIGEIGVTAEQVARRLVKEFRQYISADDIPVGPHLADQILLPMGIAAHQGKTSQFKTMPLSQHSSTHIDILQRFLDVKIEVEPAEGRNVLVKVSPK